jgi:hypothetical protein
MGERARRAPLTWHPALVAAGVVSCGRIGFDVAGRATALRDVLPAAYGTSVSLLCVKFVPLTTSCGV